MPNSKQAKKRNRQDERRRVMNKSRRSTMNTEIKKMFAAVTAGDVAKAKELLSSAMSKIDRAAKQNVIHRNTAARRKALLSRRLRDLQASAS